MGNTHLKSPGRLLLLLCLAGILWAGLQACAPVSAPRQELLPPDPDRVWSDFEHNFTSRGDLPFWIKASLNFSGPERSHRSTFEFWGHTGLPLRLDLMAGIGVTVSLWRIDENGLLAYYPRQRVAYLGPDSSQGLEHLGFPCPLSVQGLADILTGQAASSLPSTYNSASPKSERQTEYRFSRQSRIQSLILDEQGRITSMAGEHPYTWSLKVDDYELIQKTPIARSYRLQTEKGHKAVVRIKEVRFRSQPWPEKAMSLPLPEDTTRLPLGG
ncbi:MAG: hypothetical protein ACLFT5_02390 [Desulfovermiculus sp.]